MPMDADLFTPAFNAAGASYAPAGVPFLDEFADLIAERLDLRPGATVIDLATGPGTGIATLARAVGSTGSVVGIDLADRQLEIARGAAAALTTPTRFVHMDACALDFPDGRADAVSCGFGLPYFHEPLRAIREAARVVRPGARLVFTTWGDPLFGRPGTRLLQVMERQEVPTLHRPFASDPRVLAQWCFRAGLRDVVVEQFDRKIFYPDFDAWWDCNRAFAFLLRLDAAEPDMRSAIRDELAADDAVVQSDGSVVAEMRVYLLRGVS